MPSARHVTRKMDDAIALMDEIGIDGWRARRAYTNGEIGEAELEERLDRSMGIGGAGDDA